ncbi:hypothetical protein HPC49_00650 [Pyxidicoccus fallax]|uniref:Calcineurin-like phosphoesterase domain-containing protein n=1 Tax=Pyxidicoccus fallax TaxID=394095 RepID=A0A848LDF6_9BACT|nr:metallophosphoesterase [Pyxidicoccus fallax]NMO14845.1 hypothetical protein [Pyxidicoccus fallax]NPC76764.1 hypothetical protein [Pyxidicoccus fallax]
MSWYYGGCVPAEHDYRDPALIDTLIQEARRGMVLLGTSRIGKTSLLARIHENPARKSCAPLHVLDGADRVLSKLTEVDELLLFDEAQGLVKWTDNELRELRRRIDGRPFILAAWPTLMASQVPDELSRLLEDACREWLRPLGREEAARMIRRERSISPTACEEEVVNAIYRATAGFPNLIAGLCRFLMDNGTTLWAPTEENLRGFIDSGFYSGTFRDIYRSLPLRMQEVLDESCRGMKTRLDTLRGQGLVTGNPAAFSGTLFEYVWGSGGDWKLLALQEERRPSRPPRPPRPALTWLHVSDLHFGAGPQSHRFNQETITEELLKDVRARRPWDPDFLFVTGDIAFSASPTQYEKASAWLKQLVEAAGTTPEALRLVPGNHDVDRELAKRCGDIHAAIRGHPGEDSFELPPARLDERLHDPAIREALREKLKAYAGFVNSLASNHPKADDGTPLDWCESLEPTPQRPGRLWLVGLCSVWVSDKGDAERRLVMGEKQLRTLQEVQEDDLVFLLTHHPPGWLHPTAEELLLERLAERAHHVHLCGHVHAASARAMRGLGMPRDSLRLVAGAGHGESSGEHGYAWGALRWSRDRWEMGWAPRIFERGRGVRPDRNRYDLDDEGFAWEPLPRLQWKPPPA